VVHRTTGEQQSSAGESETENLSNHYNEHSQRPSELGDEEFLQTSGSTEETKLQHLHKFLYRQDQESQLTLRSDDDHSVHSVDLPDNKRDYLNCSIKHIQADTDPSLSTFGNNEDGNLKPHVKEHAHTIVEQVASCLDYTPKWKQWVEESEVRSRALETENSDLNRKLVEKERCIGNQTMLLHELEERVRLLEEENSTVTFEGGDRVETLETMVKAFQEENMALKEEKIVLIDRVSAMDEKLELDHQSYERTVGILEEEHSRMKEELDACLKTHTELRTKLTQTTNLGEELVDAFNSHFEQLCSIMAENNNSSKIQSAFIPSFAQLQNSSEYTAWGVIQKLTSSFAEFLFERDQELHLIEKKLEDSYSETASSQKHYLKLNQAYQELQENRANLGMKIEIWKTLQSDLSAASFRLVQREKEGCQLQKTSSGIDSRELKQSYDELQEKAADLGVKIQLWKTLQSDILEKNQPLSKEIQEQHSVEEDFKTSDTITASSSSSFLQLKKAYEELQQKGADLGVQKLLWKNLLSDISTKPLVSLDSERDHETHFFERQSEKRRMDKSFSERSFLQLKQAYERMREERADLGVKIQLWKTLLPDVSSKEDISKVFSEKGCEKDRFESVSSKDSFSRLKQSYHELEEKAANLGVRVQLWKTLSADVSAVKEELHSVLKQARKDRGVLEYSNPQLKNLVRLMHMSSTKLRNQKVLNEPVSLSALYFSLAHVFKTIEYGDPNHDQTPTERDLQLVHTESDERYSLNVAPAKEHFNLSPDNRRPQMQYDNAVHFLEQLEYQVKDTRNSYLDASRRANETEAVFKLKEALCKCYLETVDELEAQCRSLKSELANSEQKSCLSDKVEKILRFGFDVQSNLLLMEKEKTQVLTEEVNDLNHLFKMHKEEGAEIRRKLEDFDSEYDLLKRDVIKLKDTSRYSSDMESQGVSDHTHLDSPHRHRNNSAKSRTSSQATSFAFLDELSSRIPEDSVIRSPTSIQWLSKTKSLSTVEVEGMLQRLQIQSHNIKQASLSVSQLLEDLKSQLDLWVEVEHKRIEDLSEAIKTNDSLIPEVRRHPAASSTSQSRRLHLLHLQRYHKRLEQTFSEAFQKHALVVRSTNGCLDQVHGNFKHLKHSFNREHQRIGLMLDDALRELQNAHRASDQFRSKYQQSDVGYNQLCSILLSEQNKRRILEGETSKLRKTVEKVSDKIKVLEVERGLWQDKYELLERMEEVGRWS
jgi:hypothetical protein